MAAVRRLLRRDGGGRDNWWLGLQQSSATWLTSGRPRNYSHWVEGEPSLRAGEGCVVLQGRKLLRWAGWNCGYQRDGNTKFRALCMRDNLLTLSGPAPAPAPARQSKEAEAGGGSEPCLVAGLSLTGEDWLARRGEVATAAQCHQACLDTRHCRFWTWRRDSGLCYLKAEDGAAVRDQLAVSGTTRTNQGCRRALAPPGTSPAPRPAARCSCVTESHSLVAGYIDPRTLGLGLEPDTRLGRALRRQACPGGQVLSCEQSAAQRGPASNITDCLVHDVRLAVGGHVGVARGVASPQACHNLCVSAPACVFWTWRGDSPTAKCFLLPAEARLVRRRGAASGTVSHPLGCDRQLAPPPAPPSARGEECGCELEEDTPPLIDPRLLPDTGSGRIVNTDTCPEGYRRTCHVTRGAGGRGEEAATEAGTVPRRHVAQPPHRDTLTFSE